MQTLKIEASAVKADELTQLETVADRLETGSALSAFVRGVVNELRNGADVTALESEAELSPAEASKVLKISRTFLMHYIATGELQAHKVGTHHRIKVADLLDFQQRSQLARETVASVLGSDAAKEKARDSARARARAARLAAEGK